MKKLLFIIALAILLEAAPAALAEGVNLPVENNIIDSTIIVDAPVFKTAVKPGHFAVFSVKVTNNSHNARIINLDITLMRQNDIIARFNSFQTAYIAYASKEAEIGTLFPLDLTGCRIVIRANEINPAVSYYVSPEGDDSNDGSINAPFKTIEQARDAVRGLKFSRGLPDGGVAVYLMSGNYNLLRTVSFTNQDSGTYRSPIIYTAYPGADVRFNGAYTIPSSAFAAVIDSSVLQRMLPSARGNVLQADLKALGIQNYGSVSRSNPFTRDNPSTNALYVDGRKQTLARWPNTGYALTGAVVSQAGTDDGGVFKFTDNNSQRWANAEDAWVHGYWSQDWYDDSIKIKRVDNVNNTITLAQSTYGGIAQNKRYFAFNMLEELDMPGEWYLNRDTGILYYYPEGDISGKRILLSSCDSALFSLKDCNYIYFSNIKFEATRAGGFDVDDCNNILIAGCSFNGIGGQAVNISGGSNCGVLSSDISNGGRGGIFMSGGDRPTLTPANHYVDNCDIYNFATENFTYTPAVYIMGCGNKVTHSKIHSGPHLGITLDGNDHIIAYNEIYDLCRESNDAGGIYGGRDWTQRGSVIRGNIFHDIYGNNGTGCHAVYFDDMLSGNTVCQNIFYNVYCGVFMHGGRDNTVVDNIAANVMNPVWLVNISNSSSVTDPNGELIKRYNLMPVTSTLWVNKYPHISNILQDEPTYPKYNNFSRNLFYKSGGLKNTAQSLATGVFENNYSTSADPGFTDAENNDYTIKAGTNIQALIPGFQQSAEKAGLYIDKYRTSINN